jgi:hypothetical protein
VVGRGADAGGGLPCAGVVGFAAPAAGGRAGVDADRAVGAVVTPVPEEPVGRLGAGEAPAPGVARGAAGGDFIAAGAGSATGVGTGADPFARGFCVGTVAAAPKAASSGSTASPVAVGSSSAPPKSFEKIPIRRVVLTFHGKEKLAAHQCRPAAT